MLAPQRFNIQIDWVALSSDHDDWHASRCLYAYAAPEMRELLYIGMTWDQTIRVRWNYSAKPDFWNFLQHQRRLTHHVTLAGHIALPPGRRLSKELLVDVESLLVSELQPCGNIQATNSRISRPGMAVHCLGQSWPGPLQFFDQ